MDSRILTAIHEEAIRVFPNEACGVIVAQGKRGVVIPCKNISEEPTKFFVMDPMDYARAANNGDIVAIWHTHPNASSDASGTDLAGVESTALEWIIVGVRKAGDQFVFDKPKTYRPTGYEAPYLERPYLVGIYDCYSLVRDYYRREFGIELSQYLHSEKWWEEGKNLLVENFTAEGFVQLIGKEPQVGDLFFIQSGGEVPNHCAIYVGDDKILHHCFDRLSRLDVYGGGYWQKHTTHHLRHQTKC